MKVLLARPVLTLLQVQHHHHIIQCTTAPPTELPTQMACPLGAHQGAWIAQQGFPNIRWPPKASYLLKLQGVYPTMWQAGGSGHQAQPLISDCPRLDPCLDPRSIKDQACISAIILQAASCLAVATVSKSGLPKTRQFCHSSVG